MAVAIETLLPEARIELPGVPEPVLTAALYRNVRKFFWESEAWVYTYDNPLDWTATVRTVPSPVPGTDTPVKTVVKRVDTIKYGSDGLNHNTFIPFKTRDELDRHDSNWWTRTGSTPSAWTNDADGAAIITPIAETTVTDGLLIRSVIVPVYTALADTLPDVLYYDNEEGIRAGILYELMKMPGRDWSNPAAAIMYKQMYEDGKDMAKSRADASYGQPSGVMSYGGIEQDFRSTRRNDYGRY